jgi:hypothetical protein
LHEEADRAGAKADGAGAKADAAGAAAEAGAPAACAGAASARTVDVTRTIAGVRMNLPTVGPTKEVPPAPCYGASPCAGAAPVEHGATPAAEGSGGSA